MLARFDVEVSWIRRSLPPGSASSSAGLATFREVVFWCQLMNVERRIRTSVSHSRLSARTSNFARKTLLRLEMPADTLRNDTLEHIGWRAIDWGVFTSKWMILAVCTIEGGTQLKGRADEKLTNSLRTPTASGPRACSSCHGTGTTGLSARPSRKQDQAERKSLKQFVPTERRPAT